MLGLFFIFCVFFLVKLLNYVASKLAEAVILSREELSAYECGFECHSSSRVPFSLRYFFLTMIFLLFDLEIVLLVFLPWKMLTGYLYFFIILISMFVLILFLGLIYEWYDGSLEWIK